MEYILAEDVPNMVNPERMTLPPAFDPTWSYDEIIRRYSLHRKCATVRADVKKLTPCSYVRDTKTRVDRNQDEAQYQVLKESFRVGTMCFVYVMCR